MARKVQIEWQEDAETLLSVYRKAQDVKERQRLHGLLLIRQGKSIAETAKILNVHYRTVQGMQLAWYRQGDLQALGGHRHGGSRVHSRRLSCEQEAALKQKADAGELQRIEDGVEWARNQHQVHYSYWGMRHVFARLGLQQKVPQPCNPKASARCAGGLEKRG